MWLNFSGVEYKTDLKNRDGKQYSGWVITGTRRGFDGAEDTDWSRVIFENTPVTVIEQGIHRAGQSLLQFLQKACQPGDLLVIKSVRKGTRWEIATIENRSINNKLEYNPLTTEERAKLLAQAVEVPADPTRPAAPTTALMTPVDTKMWSNKNA